MDEMTAGVRSTYCRLTHTAPLERRPAATSMLLSFVLWSIFSMWF